MFFSKAWKVEGTSCWKSSTFHSLPTWSEWKILMICVWRRKEGRKECHTHGTHFLKCHSSFLMMNLSLFWWVGGHSSFEMVQVSIFKASRWIQRGFRCIFLFYVSSPSHPKRSADSPGARTPAVTRLGCKFLGSIGLHQGFELWNLPQKNEHEKRDKKKIIPS